MLPWAVNLRPLHLQAHRHAYNQKKYANHDICMLTRTHVHIVIFRVFSEFVNIIIPLCGLVSYTGQYLAITECLRMLTRFLLATGLGLGRRS